MPRKKKGNFKKHKDFSYEYIEKLASLGLNMTQIGALFDVSKDTVEREMKNDKELNAAIEKGRSKAIVNVAKMAYDQAISGKNPAMTMFWLKCRANWSEKNSVDHTSSDGSMRFVFVENNGKKD